jgi:hypothetical protein
MERHSPPAASGTARTFGIALRKNTGWGGFQSTTAPAFMVVKTGAGGRRNLSTIILVARRWSCGWRKQPEYRRRSCLPRNAWRFQADQVELVIARQSGRLSRGPLSKIGSDKNPSRAEINFFNQINVICPVQSPAKKYFCFAEAKSLLYSRHPVPQRGVSGSSETRGGERWTRQRQARQ